MAALGLIHGLAALFISDLVPAAHARELAEEIFTRARAHKTERKSAA
jgi:hypothetical protein